MLPNDLSLEITLTALSVLKTEISSGAEPARLLALSDLIEHGLKDQELNSTHEATTKLARYGAGADVISLREWRQRRRGSKV